LLKCSEKMPKRDVGGGSQEVHPLDDGRATARRPPPRTGGAAGRRRLRRCALAAGAALVLAAGVDPAPPPSATGVDAQPAAAAERDAAGAVPPELRAVAERIPGSLPPRVALDRLALTPYHAVLSGHAPDLGAVADLVESLEAIPGLEEPELRRVLGSERGVEFSVVLAPSRPAPAGAARDVPAPPTPPPYAAPPVARALFRLLHPPST
jgi:hypothetical protein